jgi:ABC-type branched-subunit amino acid transport system substrate-binding protein
VLGRPVEAFYADNARKPDIGVPAAKRLLEQEHVPVIIGALCTPVTHAIMPLMQEAKVPLVIATSAGQDFVVQGALRAGAEAASFFVYEATYLVVDAIRRAGSDPPAAIEQALKTTTMPSLLGGTYAPDDHNHAHTPL